MVYDLFECQVVAENTEEFVVELPKRSTTLWYTGPRALLKGLES